MDKHLSLSSLIVLTPRRCGLLAGQDNTVDLLVRIQAPDAPEGHTAVRPPQAIALVIDRSGSMDGRPLAEARRCAEYVAAKLRPTDAVSLVQFDNRVQRLWPAVPAAMKEIAQSRSRERMMKESMYSASKLRCRLSAKDEEVRFSVASESIERPAYLRRKPSQGKGQV